MASRIQCPQCESAFAYNPSLLGKLVKCRQCQHTFAIEQPPDEPSAPTPPPIPAPSEASAERTIPVPPPLPPKVVTDRDEQRRARFTDRAERERQTERSRERADRLERDDDDEDRDRDGDRVGRRREGNAPKRSSGTGMLVAGLAACFVLFAVLLGGLAYALWPSKSAPTMTASNPTTSPIDPSRNAQPTLPPAPPAPPVLPPIGPPKNIKPIDVPPINDIKRPVEPPVFPPAPVRPPLGPGNPPRAKAGPDEPGGLAKAIFPPIEAIPMTAAPLALEREERKLPGPAEHGVLAAGGKLILLLMNTQRSLAVFDTTTAKVEKIITLPDPQTMVCGGLNFFLLYSPVTNKVERYNCRTLEKEATGAMNIGEPIADLAMGHASNGPIVAAVGGNRLVASQHSAIYIDPIKLTEINYEIVRERNSMGLGGVGRRPTVRMNAQGTVSTGWDQTRSTGAQCDVLQGGRVLRCNYLGRVQTAFPSADGATLFSRNGLYTPELKMIGAERARAFDPVSFVPASSGEWFVGIASTSKLGGPPTPPRCELFYGRHLAPIHSIGTLDQVEAPQFMKETVTPHDRMLFVVPEARLMVVIDQTQRDRLLLTRLDPEALTERAAVDFVSIRSTPPGQVSPGETFRYEPTIKSRVQPVRLTLENAPPEMKIVGNKVEWKAPADGDGVEATLVASAGNATTRQLLRIVVKK